MFDIRRNGDHKDKISIALRNGSYLLMKPGFQEEWQHRIAKSEQAMGARVNLTFRMLDKRGAAYVL